MAIISDNGPPTRGDWLGLTAWTGGCALACRLLADVHPFAAVLPIGAAVVPLTLAVASTLANRGHAHGMAYLARYRAEVATGALASAPPTVSVLDVVAGNLAAAAAGALDTHERLVRADTARVRELVEYAAGTMTELEQRRALAAAVEVTSVTHGERLGRAA